MDKSILVFSNGEKIGDGIIKLPLLYEIKRRMPEKKLVWMTNKGPTVYNNELKNIANQFIDEIIEKANLNPFFWTKISNKYNLKNREFEYILDTQKVVSRTLALKRIKSEHFISSSGSGIFSTIKIMQNKKSNSRRYYLDDLFDLLDLIKKEEINTKFKIEIPKKLENILSNKFKKDHLYLGLAPGAGEKNKIWPLENFIDVGKYFEKKSFTIVLFLGPEESPEVAMISALEGIEPHAPNLIAVGDVTVQTLLDMEITPDVALIDGKTKRKVLESSETVEHSSFEQILFAKNPAGLLTPSLFTACSDAISSDLSTLIVVEGEEDMAPMYLHRLAPLGTVILYGQPGKGVVLRVTDEFVKERCRSLLDAFEVL